ncbi:MAG: hypothetical protein PVI54_12920 [Desulfobacteraceae bacterium]|jgi:hypothetical protein
MDEKQTRENGSFQKASQETRITLNFKTASQKNHFNEQIELIAKANECNKNDALKIITNLLEKQMAAEGYGEKKRNFTGQYYTLLEIHTTALLRELKRALQNCEKSIAEINDDKNSCVAELNGKIETQEIEHKKLTNELTQKKDALAAKIKSLTETNKELIEKNKETENSLKSSEKLISALENERDLLKKESSDSLKMVHKVKELSTERDSLLFQIASLKSENEKLAHNHELQIKQCELNFQKQLSEKISSTVSETETKIKGHYEPVVSELKKMVSDHAEQLKIERENVEKVRFEERARSEERIKQLEDQLMQAQKIISKQSHSKSN